MAELNVVNLENKNVGKIDVADEVFAAEVKTHLLHSVTRVDRMNRRGGNAKVKSRSEIRGGGSKPWRQKGTGNARSGTASSPIWVGGGVAFGPKPKTFRLSINKKVRKAALRSALSMKLRDNDLLVVENFDLSDAKTKVFNATIEKLGATKPMIVCSNDNRNLDLSSRNVVGAKVLKCEGLNVYDILNHKTLILTRDSVEKIQEALLK